MIGSHSSAILVNINVKCKVFRILLIINEYIYFANLLESYQSILLQNKNIFSNFT